MAIDFSKYGTPIKSETGNSINFSKYGTPVAGTDAGTETVEPKKKNVVQKVSNAIQAIFPGKKVGEAIGTLGGYIASPNKKFYDTSAPTPLQVAGDVAQGALTIGTGGMPKPTSALGKVAGLGSKSISRVAIPTAKTLGKRVAQDTIIGAGFGGTGAVAEGKDLKGIAIDTAIGGALGAGLGYGFGKAGEKLSSRVPLKEQNIQRANKLTGEILQGKPDDILRGQRVLKGTDLSKVKTYDEGYKVLDKKIKDLAGKQDKMLLKDLSRRKMGELNATLKAGEKTLKHNYVHDALGQLDDFYAKTNNQVGKAEIAQLREKAISEGLTTKEINDLARVHGERLNAYNASGELASGLTKQGAENTRAGLKSTVREFYGGKASERVDKEISDTIRVRDLFGDMNEKVNTLKQKIQERTLGAKAGYYVGKLINTLGLGSPKGIVEALIPRGQGFKLQNALDLERTLQRNIKLLQELTKKDIPESMLIQKLEEFFNNGQYSLSKDLAPAQSKIKTKIIQPIKKSRLPSKPPTLSK